MPLNPPTYKGMDVFYSTNVFVNKVPVALWQPPAGAYNDGSPGSATVGGVKMFANTEFGKAAHEQYLFATQGQEALDNETDGSNQDTVVKSSIAAYAPTGTIGSPGYTGPTGPAGGVNPNPSAPAPTSSYELTASNAPNYSPYPQLSNSLYKMRISKYFNFNIVTLPPEESRNYSARQIAGHFIELANHILDPIWGAGFHFTVTSGFRSHRENVSHGRNYLSDHELGIAADFVLGSRAQHRTVFQWIIQSGLPFWQCIWEGGWVHVSYNGGQQKTDGGRIMIMPTGKKSGGVYRYGNDVAAAVRASNGFS